MNTVGELKQFLENLDDNTPLISASTNFALQGSLVLGARMSVGKYNKTTQQCVDAFDYSVFFENVYIPDKEGFTCLRVG